MILKLDKEDNKMESKFGENVFILSSYWFLLKIIHSRSFVDENIFIKIILSPVFFLGGYYLMKVIIRDRDLADSTGELDKGDLRQANILRFSSGLIMVLVVIWDVL